MKKLLCSLAILGSLIAGCSVNHIPDDPSDKNFPTVVAKVKTEVKNGTVLSTSSVLLLLTEESRTKVANEANGIARITKTAVENNNMDLPALKAYALTQILNSDDPKDRTMAMLINTIASLIESNLDAEFGKLPDDVRLSVGKELVVAALDSVIEITQPFVYRTNT